MKNLNKFIVKDINQFFSELLLIIVFLMPLCILKLLVRTFFSVGAFTTNQVFFKIAGIFQLLEPAYLLIWVTNIFMYIILNYHMIFIIINCFFDKENK